MKRLTVPPLAYVDTIAALQALSSNYGIEAVIAAGNASVADGGGGTFLWVSTDQSANVSTDAAGAMFVAPNSDATGASGAWVRQFVAGQQISVKWFGATGNGTDDDTAAIQAAANFCFGSLSNPNGQPNCALNLPLYFPNGTYKISAPITFRSVHGGRITGAGRFTTTINQVTSGKACFVTNGFEYVIVEGIYFQSGGSGAVCFDLDWDNTGTAALQSNTFRDCAFGSVSTPGGPDIGLRIGNTGYMGSENLIINCQFANCTVAGSKICNFNALDNDFIGGNVVGCANVGIWVSEGSAPCILNVAFENGQNTYDIQVDNSAGDVINIIGCRSESENFANLANSPHAFLSACEHISTAGNPNGTFLTLPTTNGGVATVERCSVTKAKIFTHDSPRLSVRGSSFGLSAWLDTSATGIPLPAGCVIEIEDVQFNGTPNGGGLSTTNRIYRQRIDANGTSNYNVTLASGIYSHLPVSPTAGIFAVITDSTTNTWGATISGSGSDTVLGYFNGTNWTVAAK